MRGGARLVSIACAGARRARRAREGSAVGFRCVADARAAPFDPVCIALPTLSRLSRLSADYRTFNARVPCCSWRTTNHGHGGH